MNRRGDYILSAIFGAYAGTALAAALLRLFDPDLLGGPFALIVLFAGTVVALPASIFMNLVVMKPLVAWCSGHRAWRWEFLPLLGAAMGLVAICAATLLMAPFFNAQEPKLESFLGYAIFGVSCGFCTTLFQCVFSVGAGSRAELS